MRETRYAAGTRLEVRAAGTDAMPTIVGYGATFNRYSQNLGGFVEQISPDAFTDTLARGGVVKSFANHDPNVRLGRTDAGNLILSVDVTGIRYEVTPPPTQAARDLIIDIDHGLVPGSSFTFRTLPDGDSWSLTEQGFPLRTLHAVELYEIGPVADPAYLSTEEEGAAVALRSLARTLNRRPEEVMEAAAANELRAVMSPIEAAQEQDDPAKHASRLFLQRQRLALASRR
jgi:HK97 family phage prohead protease